MWPDASPRRAPLGLPPGSLRAIMTLLILAVVLVQTARGEALDAFWSNTLLIVLAHYFTSRRLVRLPPDVLARLENEGGLPIDPPPLFLPKRSIRSIIVLSFVGLGVFLYQHGRFANLDWANLGTLDVFLIAAVYLIGVLWGGLTSWWAGRRGADPSPRWADLKAAVVLLILAATAIAYLAGRPDLVPGAAHKMALGLVLFYFGSR